MKLGAFSISLTVKDINISKEFYEVLGFSVFAGDIDKKYLIMKNGNSLIGLFEGMFDKNTLTFNPGWNESAEKVESFVDVRDIRKQVEENGIKIVHSIENQAKGPASFMIIDPDGNPILVDQHV